MLELDAALESLSRAGLRRTPQRIAIIDALVDDRTHPTAETLWETVRARMPGVSLSTVYDTLHELESLGLIQYVPNDDAVRIDPDVSPHAHLTCAACGKVADIPDEGATETAREAASRLGHKVERVSVILDGICSSCTRRRRGRHVRES